MTQWQLIHRHRSLVRDGKANPLICPQCKNEFAVMVGEDELPVLWCVWEDELYKTGSQFWADVRAVVKEYYLEE